MHSAAGGTKMVRTSSMYSADDPLGQCLRPPETETEDERRARLEREYEARRVSDGIDEQLKNERKKWEKQRRQEVKLLLLGQAESAPVLAHQAAQLAPSPSRLLVLPHRRGGPHEPRTPGQHELAALRLRLSPLTGSERALADRLNEGVALRSGSGVYARQGWQARVARSLSSASSSRDDDGAAAKRQQHQQDEDRAVAEIARVLEASVDDVVKLWEHPTVLALMKRRRLRLDEWSEFFLKNIRRIAKASYVPTTDDILRARIQTMGVAEHVFDVVLPGQSPFAWRIYDVGGARGQRHTWVPYFDDAKAIIFLAPISAFDQFLEEDSKTNRIDDSLQLFTQICANPLLANVHLVLFLNKTDVLRAKLESGLRLQKYVTSFGDKTNDYETVSRYFVTHFTLVHKRNSVHSKSRVLYTHLTNVVDTQATQSIIANGPEVVSEVRWSAGGVRVSPRCRWRRTMGGGSVSMKEERDSVVEIIGKMMHE
ncbi:G-alpha-domain-containing protein [Punctularia strigosozonata HHB-11173 SS5]|uniref:G-alpha-domain-containing protein n=1 Tax=Punctularia strigosozonata (strain HHB-11173) TaxID=741275 RepID=R7S351_PUNST|nr:G-alpha-domain-containing protein [Punctularia strigosozonata HHB-11173 SS5]EIN04815.1 G-alpha-domain-containing protein [Punctularia strigosozonata HHB-11173 SS5]